MLHIVSECLHCVIVLAMHIFPWKVAICGHRPNSKSVRQFRFSSQLPTMPVLNSIYVNTFMPRLEGRWRSIYCYLRQYLIKHSQIWVCDHGNGFFRYLVTFSMRVLLLKNKWRLMTNLAACLLGDYFLERCNEIFYWITSSSSSSSSSSI